LTSSQQLERPAALLGHQTPRILTAPQGLSSSGQDAVDLAAVAGINLDPWQRLFLDVCLSEGADGRYAASEIGLVVARQNGKGELLVALELAGLFLLGERTIMHSAHRFNTASDGFRRLLAAIDSSPDLRAQVARVSKTNGKEGIELKSGARCLFFARSVDSGRGFTVDRLILDEAYNLTDAQISAMSPTMAAVDNPQVIYTSSAVNAEEHDNGLVLARVRARGIRGDAGLAYLEWSAHEDADHRDPQAWAMANPALGIRMRADGLERDQRLMSPKTFAVERLSIGDWPSEDGTDRVISEAEWSDQARPDARTEGRVVFAVHAGRDSACAAISVAGVQQDGSMLVQLVQVGNGVAWVAPRMAELAARHKPLGIVVDAKSDSSALIQPLAEVGLKDLLMPTTNDVARGCGEFRNAVIEHRLFHTDARPLNEALAGAKKRDLAGAWAWDRRDYMTDLSPIVSATLAVWGFTELRSRVVDVSASFW
jgi:hypothetical protein